MGRYSSSDSEDEKRKSRKKKKRRSRSRSESSDNSSYSVNRKSKKSKKSKKKQKKRSRSRSRSSEYRKRRSRSRSRRRSQSRSKGRRSRSSSYSSRYKSRRSRSRSRKRSRSRSVTRRKSRSRSIDSSSRLRRRSRSNSRSKKSSRSSSITKDSKALKTEKEDPCANIPGFSDMPTAKQNEIRMKMALKAAAETDARLREQGVLLPTGKKEKIEMGYDDDHQRSLAISQIEGDGFTQQSFSSSKSQSRVKEESVDDVHESAMFGDSASLPKAPTKAIVYKDTDSILGPMFYEDPDVKWERWIQHVKEFRRKKLEGEEMVT